MVVKGQEGEAEEAAYYRVLSRTAKGGECLTDSILASIAALLRVGYLRMVDRSKE